MANKIVNDLVCLNIPAKYVIKLKIISGCVNNLISFTKGYYLDFIILESNLFYQLKTNTF